MKIIVTHSSPDLDGITSIWLIKKFLQGWENAEIKFVSAGERLGERGPATPSYPIEQIDGDEVIHVDTGMGFFDHHQFYNTSVSSASLVWEFVKVQSPQFKVQNDKTKTKTLAIDRIIKLIVEMDHFKEVYWENPIADYHELSLLGIQDGLKLQMPGSDNYYVEFLSKCLDALLHNFENRVWAETEISENGIEFKTKWGKGIAIETINDSILQLAQKMGYVVVVRKDPRKGFVRIKAKPSGRNQKEDVDLTVVYEKLKKMDPEATWYLHVSKKMLLNGTSKNPKMKPTTLCLDDIIKVLESI